MKNKVVTNPITKVSAELKQGPQKFNHGFNTKRMEFGPQQDLRYGAAPGFEFVPSSMSYGHFPTNQIN
mgnify:CR=1 FL=1